MIEMSNVQTIQPRLSGRSMIEMLGVLAIIGVLSIAALAGIRMAMTKHQANLIIEDVKLAGFIVKDELFNTLPSDGSEQDLTGRFTPAANHTYHTFKESDTTYAVVVDGMSERVCLELKKRKVEWLEEIRANGERNVCDASDTNAMSFFFNESLNAELSTGNGLCIDDVDCGECGKCINRKCVYETGEVVSGTTCKPCSTSGTITNTTKESCRQCPNRVYTGASDIGGNCALCSAQANLITRKEDCLACGNRYWQENGYCRFCQGTVSADGMACEWDCPSGTVGAENTCFDCVESSPSLTFSSLFSCRQCPNRVYTGASDIGGICYLCSIQADIITRKEDCLACGNRYWQENGYCRFCQGTVTADGTGCEWDCPSGTVGAGSTCFDCVDSYPSLIFSSLSSCRQCPNRVYTGASDIGGTCQLCSTQADFPQVRKEDCLACGNRYWQENGYCRFCQGTVTADGTGCEWDCPSGTVGAGSTCFDCVDSYPSLTHSSLSSCRLCPNRFYSGASDIGGTCQLCSTQADFPQVRKEDCLACGNRYWQENGYCRFCQGTVSADGMACI